MIYCDLTMNGSAVWIGKPCLTNVGLCHYAYVGFAGQLLFIDTQGSADPQYSGLGTRWQLVYYATGPDAVIVPLQSVPSQQFDVTLGSQYCTVSIYESSPS